MLQKIRQRRFLGMVVREAYLVFGKDQNSFSGDANDKSRFTDLAVLDGFFHLLAGNGCMMCFMEKQQRLKIFDFFNTPIGFGTPGIMELR